MLRVHASDDGVFDARTAHHGANKGILGHLFLSLHRRALEQPRDHGRQHLDMSNFLGRDIEHHISIFLGTAAGPALKEIGHHDADLAPLAAKRLLKHFCEDRIGLVWFGVILKFPLTQEHGVSFCEMA
jgi:hypothetical protein